MRPPRSARRLRGKMFARARRRRAERPSVLKMGVSSALICGAYLLLIAILAKALPSEAAVVAVGMLLIAAVLATSRPPTGKRRFWITRSFASALPTIAVLPAALLPLASTPFLGLNEINDVGPLAAAVTLGWSLFVIPTVTAGDLSGPALLRTAYFGFTFSLLIWTAFLYGTQGAWLLLDAGSTRDLGSTGIALVLLVVGTPFLAHLLPRLPDEVTRRFEALRTARHWSPRDVVTVSVSIAALLVSISALLLPQWTADRARSSAAETYLKYVASSSSFAVNAGVYYAEDGSPAQAFAQRVLELRSASSDEPLTDAGMAIGSMTDSSFALCFATLRLMPITCAVADDFVISDSGKVQDFTVDEVPVAALLGDGGAEERDWQSFRLPRAGLELSMKQTGLVRGIAPNRGDGRLTPIPDRWTAILQVRNEGDRAARLVSARSPVPSDEDIQWSDSEVPERSTSYVAIEMPAHQQSVDLCFAPDDEDETCIRYKLSQ